MTQAPQDPAEIRVLQALSYVTDGEYRSPYELAMKPATLKKVTRKGWATAQLHRRPYRIRGGKELAATVPCYRITESGRKRLAKFEEERDAPKKAKPKARGTNTGRAPDNRITHPWCLGGRRA